MLVYASGQCMEQRSCGCSLLWHSAPPGMAVGCCELRLRSTPRYRLVCICFPPPGRVLPYGSGLGLSRCLGPGECLHSFIQHTPPWSPASQGVAHAPVVLVSLPCVLFAVPGGTLCYSPPVLQPPSALFAMPGGTQCYSLPVPQPPCALLAVPGGTLREQ